MGKTLNLQSQYGGEIKVSLEINTYLNNGCMYIGLVEQGGIPGALRGFDCKSHG